MDKKLEYIKILLEKKEDTLGGPFDLIIHSILNTIDIRVLIDINLSLPNSSMKASIESNIFKRFQTIENPKDIYDSLYLTIKDTSYYKRQRIRKMLLELLPRLDVIYKVDFFNTFFHSKYSNDVKSALSMCGAIWDEKFDTLMLNKYFKTEKEIYLKTFVYNGNIEYCLPLVQRIWETNPGNHYKIILIRRLVEKHFEVFEFLREIEPDKYLFAISLSNKIVEDNILVDCLSHISNESKPYGILSLSKTGKWDLIKEEIEKYVC